MNRKREKRKGEIWFFVVAEALFFLFLLSLFPNYVLAIVGEGNVTVGTELLVGSAAPVVVNITLIGGNSIDLAPNSTVNVSFAAVIIDYNGEGNLDNFTAVFFDSVNSAYGSADDNNNHYTNNSCVIDTSYGNGLEANATCTFAVQYYSNNQTWSIIGVATDQDNLQGNNSNAYTVNSLLALGLPDSIDYGTVNGTEVSQERIANVTNFGNMRFNLSLSGYGGIPGDGWAMNCTLGNNISIGYEKFNLTASNNSILNLSQFEGVYLNLTSSNAIRSFNLNYRNNDAAPYIDDTNSTYWRIYVPNDVGGTCAGNIVFGAVIGGES